MYEELNKYVTGEKRLIFFNTYKASKLVEQIILDEIRNKGFVEPEYKLYCVVKDNRGYDSGNLGVQIFKDKEVSICINKRLIDGLDNIATPEDVEKYDDMDRDYFTRIDLFMIMFHELEHVNQSKMYLNSTVDNPDLYKDEALTIYFDHLKEETKNSDMDYYSSNYKVITQEVLANIKGIEKTIDYFNKYNIELTKEELEILKLRMEMYKEILKNKQRKNPLDGKIYDLDDLYNIILQDQTYTVDSLAKSVSGKHL